ncbi:hypothetical protein HQ560_21820, partial [bacterium]|nr:hypothetical protein [bacterium]
MRIGRLCSLAMALAMALAIVGCDNAKKGDEVKACCAKAKADGTVCATCPKGEEKPCCPAGEMKACCAKAKAEGTECAECPKATEGATPTAAPAGAAAIIVPADA